MSIKEEVEQSDGKGKFFISCSQKRVQYGSTCWLITTTCNFITGMKKSPYSNFKPFSLHCCGANPVEYNHNIETVTTGAMVIVRLSLKRIKQWHSFKVQQCVRVRTPPLLRSVKQFTLYKIGEMLAQW